MGIVTESRASEPRAYTRWAVDSDEGYKSRPTVRVSPQSDWQSGYRSGPLSKGEIGAITELDSTGQRWDIKRQLHALERLQDATSNSPWQDRRPFIVNDRSHIRTRRNLASVPYNVSTSTKSARGRLVADLSGHRPPFASPDPDEFRALASEMMRGMSPLKPGFDLTRFVLELRDVNRIFEQAASLPSLIRPNGRSGGFSDLNSAYKGAGGSYLAYQFGVAPTISDVKNGAEAIINADKKFGQFVRDSARQVKRSSMRTLDHWTTERRTFISFGTTGTDGLQSWVPDDHGDFRWRRRTLLRPDSIPVNVSADAIYSMSSVCTLRTFATFEFFVGDPDGFTSRMDEYVAKAKTVLGSGLTASTMYELTPWSWMADWYVDIGGLLSYQQQVADYSLVARQAGFSITTDTTSALTLLPRDTKNTISKPSYASYTTKQVERRAGSPYSMEVAWDMDTFKWSILGALGMTKGLGIPNRR